MTTRAAQPRHARPAGRASAALAGVAAVLLGIGLGTLTAALFVPASSPLPVVGGAMIDLAPPWAKDTMIALFGTGDKLALIIGILVAMIALGALAGVWEWRRAWSGAAVALALGAAAAIVAITREDAGMWAWLPSVLAGVAAAMAMRMLVRWIPVDAAATVRADGTATTRRGFLTLAGVTAAVGILTAVGGSMVRAGSQAVSTIRAALKLPAAASTAITIPDGADLEIPGLSPLVTPNADFYRIDTALVVPNLDPAEWELRVHGLVEQEVRLTWNDLLALPLREAPVTLSCVSNQVGGGLVGNAVWLGYPIRELLARARPLAEADMVLSRSSDGFTASTPLGALTDDRDALLAIGMNGEPLPLEHGFPVRMVVPGLYGYVSATKWVVELEVTRFDRDRAYWTDRGWSEKGPIKLQSRVDVPRSQSTWAAGPVTVAGVAWMPHTGVSGVQVQIDDDPWQDAELGWDASTDTWVQWRWTWDATPGPHRVTCRAIDADGNMQVFERRPVAPDGATGWHTVTVDIT